MERYNRAWRDPGSPLTPLTPLSTQVFKFDTKEELTPTGGDTMGRSTFRSLTSSHLAVPTRFSQSFLRTRSVFSPNSQSTANGSNSSAGGGTTRSFSSRTSRKSSFSTKVKREPGLSDSSYSRFKHGSPVEHPTLSPRVRSLLNRTGNEHLTEMFTRQEIDLEVLIQMTLDDLEALGVRGARELKLAMEVIKFAKKIFC
ncbi:uncharacterized protein LOC108152385 [Drosophila miranda]|uniref:uncharacterized protein LOC108152385 n=1 Tax=Drosophila miranda TaxID=7229 RepID=UPI0007E8374C|nr:uncharacterized protein LOC108152385 [Drosophila miranda]